MGGTPHQEPDTVEALRLARLIVEGDVDAWCDQDSDKLAAHALLRLEEQLEAARTQATLTRLDDAKVVGAIFDHAREALEAAYAEFERAEEHHRWHHEQEGREVEEDEERLRTLMVIAEALEELPEPLSDDAETQVAELRASASQFVWLLERGQPEGLEWPEWYAEAPATREEYEGDWTRDPHKACRWETEAQALAAIPDVEYRTGLACRPVEHGFMSVESSPASIPKEGT